MNAAEFRAMNNLPPPGQPASAQSVGKKPQIRLPRLGDDMNKTESEFFEILKREFSTPNWIIRYEPFTLRLPSGTRYTPDFGVFPISNGGGPTFIYETKGAHIHSAASIRAFKEARAAFPFWSFIFAQKSKGEWLKS